jgi:hypothetical protein
MRHLIAPTAVRDGWRDGSARSGAGQAGGPLLPRSVPTVARGPRAQRGLTGNGTVGASHAGERSAAAWYATPHC